MFRLILFMIFLCFATAPHAQTALQGQLPPIESPYATAQDIPAGSLLVHAVQCNDYKVCVQILASKKTVSTTEPVLPALYEAIRLGRKNIVELFLNSAIDPNVRMCDDLDREQTPLHIAASFSHNSIIALLLNRGADVLSLDENGKTALHYAVECNDEKIKPYQIQCIQILLDKARAQGVLKKLLCLQDAFGENVLHTIASCSPIWCASDILQAAHDCRALEEMLLAKMESKTGFYSEEHSGSTVLHMSARRYYPSLTELILLSAHKENGLLKKILVSVDNQNRSALKVARANNISKNDKIVAMLNDLEIALGIKPSTTLSENQ